MGTALPQVRSDEQAEAAFLRRLGERVRGWRTEHGVARKTLALASGVSERYLAQLETGQGNISVLLLRRIAEAMRVPVDQLMREDGADSAELELLQRFIARLPAHQLGAAQRALQIQFGAARSQRIALLGLRGAGKSTLGMQLAEQRSVPFVELDREVERVAGSELGDVFSIYGQEAFRRFERRALERVLRSHEHAVIATGGSIVTDPDSFQLLRDHCYCIWLKTSPDEHMARVIAQGDLRPFRGRSEALEEIRRLLDERERLYARADATLDTSGKKPQASLAELGALVPPNPTGRPT